ncbi:MAG: transporter gate domain protein [Proteobacteria bacterium]|nr:transporter gate domain protein [Pseudomonadota bacterium]
MLLNNLWVGFLLTAIAFGGSKALLTGDATVLAAMTEALFTSSKNAFEIALGLTGTLAFWLGMLRIGEKGGFIALLTRFLSPLFRRLMPEIPPEHPALGAIVMNLSANVLGLDNAATPLGIKAMQELQTLNTQAETASDAQILFFVLNASSVTLFPLSILTFRAQLGAGHPADVFIPILLATSCSTFAGLASVAALQRIRLLDRWIMAYLGGFALLVACLVAFLFQQGPAELQQRSALLTHFALLGLIGTFLGGAVYRKVNAYEAFLEGATEGFRTAIAIVPYLVAMLVALAMLRASGLVEAVSGAIRQVATVLATDTRFVDALPTALIKPFSGSGARAMMLDTMRTYGVDSFAGRLATIIQGSTETTFYVLAVYFGAVGIRNARHAVGCALLADAAGVLGAIFVTYRFFG